LRRRLRTVRVGFLEKPRALMAASARRALGVLSPDREEPILGLRPGMRIALIQWVDIGIAIARVSLA
jgi:hypothetical protein